MPTLVIFFLNRSELSSFCDPAVEAVKTLASLHRQRESQSTRALRKVEGLRSAPASVH